MRSQEMLIHVEKLIRSGLNLEDALTEVGTAYGMPEVKHAFMFLGQCAKHGGELTKQLQELADAVSTQRQVRIEGKITALPVKATGPLTTVFVGFFLLILSGLLVRFVQRFWLIVSLLQLRADETIERIHHGRWTVKPRDSRQFLCSDVTISIFSSYSQVYPGYSSCIKSLHFTDSSL